MGDSSYGIWDLTTNLVTNGGFSTNTTSWIAAGGASIARDTAEHKFGVASCRVDVTNTAGSGARYIVALTSGLTYTASGWFKGPAGTPLRMIFAGTILNFVASGNWERKTITVTAGSTGNFNLDFVSGSAVFTGSYYIDGVQVENLGFPTPYVETDGGSAARLTSLVQLPAQLLNVTQGWVAIRFREDALVDQTAMTYLFGSYVDTSNVIQVARTGAITTRQLAMWRGTPTSPDSVSTFQTDWTALTKKTAIAKWTSSVIGISANGAGFVTSANTNAPSKPALMEVGTDGSGGSPLNGEVLWMMIGIGTLTDSDAAFIHAISDAGPAGLVSIVDDFNRGTGLGSRWATGWGGGVAGSIISNQWVGSAGANAGCYDTTFGQLTDGEIGCKIIAPTSTSYERLIWRAYNNDSPGTAPTGLWDGYYLKVTETGWEVGKTDNGSHTALYTGTDTGTATWVVKLDGPVMQVLRNGVRVASMYDTSYTSGWAGVQHFGNTGAIDDWVIGTVSLVQMFNAFPGTPLLWWPADDDRYYINDEIIQGVPRSSPVEAMQHRKRSNYLLRR